MSELNSDNEHEYGIEPYRLYRITHKTTQKIIGLAPTTLKKAIKNGTFPPPVPLTAFGKAAGWYAFQLIEIVKDRLAKAEARRATPPTLELPALSALRD